ncbi:hypothetical protein G9A89_000511, partial [Geosiphon pyriformis]
MALSLPPLPLLLRSCSNQLQGTDFGAFENHINHFNSVSCNLLHSTSPNDWHEALPDFNQHEVIIFYERVSNGKWVLYRVAFYEEEEIPHAQIDGYVIGDVLFTDI